MQIGEECAIGGRGFRLGGGATPVGLIGLARRGPVAAGRWAETGWARETTAGRTGPVCGAGGAGWGAGPVAAEERFVGVWPAAGIACVPALAVLGALIGGLLLFFVFGAVLFGAGFLLRGRRRTLCGRQRVFGRTGSTRRGVGAPCDACPLLFGGTSVAYRGPRFGPTFGSVFQSRSDMGGYQGIVGGMVAGRHCVQVHFRSIAHCQGLCFGGAGWPGTVQNGGGALERKFPTAAGQLGGYPRRGHEGWVKDREG